jgi:hypothetical protein
MAVVAFSKDVSFPIGPLRALLNKHLPVLRWQCGEDDTGAADQFGAYHPHILIAGRATATAVFLELRAEPGPVPGPAPFHRWHLKVGQPTTESRPIADRLLVVTCLAAMIADSADARCQVLPGGNWLDAEDMGRLFRLVMNGEGLEVAAGLGRPADGAAPGPARHGAPLQAASRDEGAVELPGMVVLTDRQLPIDGPALERFARELDPEGGWTLERNRGAFILVGRETVLGLMEQATPLPARYLAGSWARSHWFNGDRAAVERHARAVVVKAMMDTRRADWVAVRQVAKVATLAACWLARQPGALAVLNLDVGTVFAADQARDFLPILARDEFPVQLWTFAAPHALEEGRVSLSTSGLLPFLGHELEMWDAPLGFEEAGTQFSDLIRYLLTHGPVIGHGDTAGRTAGDRSIKCFLGDSRAERPHPVRALMLEVDAPATDAPKPDLPTRQAANADTSDAAAALAMADAALRRARERVRAEVMPAEPPRVPGVRRGFGRKGL